MYPIQRMVGPELDKYRRSCNFSVLERAIFDRRAAGDTIEYIAEMECVSVSTVKRILKQIQTKIERLESLC